MSRAKSCNCLCTPENPFRDCLGCPYLDAEEPPELPQEWVLDMATGLAYDTLQTTSGSTSATETVTNGATPFESFEYRYRRYDWWLPPLPPATETLVIDDMPAMGACYGAITKCVWASPGVEFYMNVWRNQISGLAVGAMCPVGGACGWSESVGHLSNANPWYYKGNASFYFPNIFSPNRLRNNTGISDARCGTNPEPCSFYTISCADRQRGCFWTLQVIKPTTTTYKLQLDLTWSPEVTAIQCTSRRTFNHTTGLWFPAHGPNFDPTGSATTSAIVDGYSPYELAAFPYSTATLNLASGRLLRYEKAVVCEDDIDGTPITIDLVEEYKRFPSSTQTMCEALGIINVPSTLTLTPIL